MYEIIEQVDPRGRKSVRFADDDREGESGEESESESGTDDSGEEEEGEGRSGQVGFTPLRMK